MLIKKCTFICLLFFSQAFAVSFKPEIANYNRVDAFRFGLKLSEDFGPFNAGIKYTYTTGSSAHYYTLEGSWQFAKKWKIGVSFMDESIPINPHYAGRFMTTLGALFSGSDYNDYFQNQGITASLKYRYNRKFDFELYANWENHFPLRKTSDYRFFGGDYKFRENPQIDQGYFVKAGIILHFSNLSNPLRPVWGYRLTPKIQLVSGKNIFYKLQLSYEKYFKMYKYQRLILNFDAVYIDTGAPYEELYSFSGFRQLPGIEIREYILDQSLLASAQYTFDGDILSHINEWIGNNFELAPAVNAGYGNLENNKIENQSGTNGIITTASIHLKEKYDLFEFVLAKRLDKDYDLKFYLSIELFDLLFGTE